ncbi:hypothetical protein CBL_05306 [Carabus blaptoides fortunei]
MARRDPARPDVLQINLQCRNGERLSVNTDIVTIDFDCAASIWQQCCPSNQSNISGPIQALNGEKFNTAYDNGPYRFILCFIIERFTLEQESVEKMALPKRLVQILNLNTREDFASFVDNPSASIRSKDIFNPPLSYMGAQMSCTQCSSSGESIEKIIATKNAGEAVERGGWLTGCRGCSATIATPSGSACLLSCDLWPMENVRNEEHDKRTAKCRAGDDRASEQTNGPLTRARFASTHNELALLGHLYALSVGAAIRTMPTLPSTAPRAVLVCPLIPPRWS